MSPSPHLFMSFTFPLSLTPTLPFSPPCKVKGQIQLGSWSDINNTTGNSISLSDPLGLWLIQLLGSRKVLSRGSKVNLPLQSLPIYKQGGSYCLGLNQQQIKRSKQAGEPSQLKGNDRVSLLESQKYSAKVYQFPYYIITDDKSITFKSTWIDFILPIPWNIFCLQRYCLNIWQQLNVVRNFFKKTRKKPRLIVDFIQVQKEIRDDINFPNQTKGTN